MSQSNWNHARAGRAPAHASAHGSSSNSVGSLPGPHEAGVSSSALESGFGSNGVLLNRGLAAPWRRAFLAERALGWLLWSALALVIVHVSR